MSRAVITSEEILFETLKAAISKKERLIVAIDGRAASGKSTLAERLSAKLNASVVHTDDFYLPFDMRTDERLSEPGGNFHRERFYDEVVLNLKGNERFEYGIFDCTSGQIASKRIVDPSGPLIVEGAYSMHNSLGKYYDVSVFVTAELSTRMERIIKRNGEERAKIFASRWIPLEENYFNTYKTDESADFVLIAD